MTRKIAYAAQVQGATRARLMLPPVISTSASCRRVARRRYHGVRGTEVDMGGIHSTGNGFRLPAANPRCQWLLTGPLSLAVGRGCGEAAQ